MGVIGCSIGGMIRTNAIQITPEILGLIAKVVAEVFGMNCDELFS
jgi:hypothetical protein